MKLTIRKFRESDTQRVFDVIQNCLTKVNAKDYPKGVIQFMTKYFSLSRIQKKTALKFSLVAVLGKNNIVGTATTNKNEVLEVFVDPKCHMLGIGSKLMKRAERIIKRAGYKYIRLKSSVTAISFYEKLNYHKKKNFYSKNFGKTILMIKKI